MSWQCAKASIDADPLGSTTPARFGRYAREHSMFACAFCPSQQLQTQFGREKVKLRTDGYSRIVASTRWTTPATVGFQNLGPSTANLLLFFILHIHVTQDPRRALPPLDSISSFASKLRVKQRRHQNRSSHDALHFRVRGTKDSWQASP
jgi:hypothetical protein